MHVWQLNEFMMMIIQPPKGLTKVHSGAPYDKTESEGWLEEET